MAKQPSTMEFSIQNVIFYINDIGPRNLKEKTVKDDLPRYPLFEEVVKSWVSGGADVSRIDYILQPKKIGAFVHLTNIDYRLFWHDIEKSLHDFHCIEIVDGIYEHRCISEDWDGSYILGGYCQIQKSGHIMCAKIVDIDL
jgi:hypothetical protein